MITENNNKITQAIAEIMDMLNKSRLSQISYHGDYATIEILTFNAFNNLNNAMTNAGLGPVSFPYEVKLSFTIDAKFANDIEQGIEQYQGNINNYYKRMMNNFKVNKEEDCVCSTQQLMVKGCTCGGK